ncbi:MAG: hypothetical protein MUF81_18290 [Verrucomicrobia bacterium]|nr:hypothetical protein [Verrucomicrobiota bacterium]
MINHAVRLFLFCGLFCGLARWSLLDQHTFMKTLTVSEAARDLATWLKQAIAGAEIAIRSDDNIVALRPIPSNGAATLSPREALRQLQSKAHLTPAQADSYLQEVHAERLATEKRSA